LLLNRATAPHIKELIVADRSAVADDKIISVDYHAART